MIEIISERDGVGRRFWGALEWLEDLQPSELSEPATGGLRGAVIAST